MIPGILVALVLLVAYGVTQLASLVNKLGSMEMQAKELAGKVDSIKEALAAEFNKEKQYYEGLEHFNSMVDMWKSCGQLDPAPGSVLKLCCWREPAECTIKPPCNVQVEESGNAGKHSAWI